VYGGFVRFEVSVIAAIKGGGARGAVAPPPRVTEMPLDDYHLTNTRRKTKKLSALMFVTTTSSYCLLSKATPFHDNDIDRWFVTNCLLHLLLTLPVSVATAERSFSTLRRLKTWLRSRMTEQRLTGLALMNIHREHSVSVDAVIDRFAKSKPRLLDFVL
jgi:hypothetical protein